MQIALLFRPYRDEERMATVGRTLSVLGWIPVYLFVNSHVVSLGAVTGKSMHPTFNPDSNALAQDIVLLSKLTAPTAYKVNDIVTLNSPTSPHDLLTKRILALDGALVKTLPPYSDTEKFVRVGKGRCWVEGDGKSHSRDSNTFGAVPIALITAKVVWIVWPLSCVVQAFIQRLLADNPRQSQSIRASTEPKQPGRRRTRCTPSQELLLSSEREREGVSLSLHRRCRFRRLPRILGPAPQRPSQFVTSISELLLTAY